MCYQASHLDEKIYRETIRIGALNSDVERLKLKCKSIKAVHKNHYNSTEFSHECFNLFTKKKLNLELCN